MLLTKTEYWVLEQSLPGLRLQKPFRDNLISIIKHLCNSSPSAARIIKLHFHVALQPFSHRITEFIRLGRTTGVS